jgi:short-subunit dehydrogenase
VVVVTGASSGIGAATARAFARRGCRLVLGARRVDVLDALALGLAERYRVEALARRCDVRVEDDVRTLVATAVERFGRVDVLVNNAGVGLYALVEQTTDGEFRDLLETNLLGVQYGIRAAVPVMRAQRAGHIVNVGSLVGKRGWPYHGAYAATKFALTGLTQTLRAELAGSGISASLVLPGNTRTAFFARSRVTVPGYHPKPLGSVQAPETVAAAIVRSVDRPRPEIYTVSLMRVAFVLAEAFPRLYDLAGKIFYSATARGTGASTSTRAASAEEAASTTGTTA